MTNDQLTKCKSTIYTDTDAELLTGYPSRWYVPVYAKTLPPSSYSTEKNNRFKLDDVNWKKGRDSLEDKLRDMSFPDNPILKAPFSIELSERSNKRRKPRMHSHKIKYET